MYQITIGISAFLLAPFCQVMITDSGKMKTVFSKTFDYSVRRYGNTAIMTHGDSLVHIINASRVEFPQRVPIYL